MTLRVACLSVVPSPYQRDLFAALAARPGIALEVFYLEAAAPDSPWPEKPLAPHEKVLAGTWFALPGARCHVNWPLPRFREYDVLIVNTLMSITAQIVLRTLPRSARWIFWGERLGGRGPVHRFLSAPLESASGIAAIGSRALADYQERFPAARCWNVPYYCALAPFLSLPRRSRQTETVGFLFCGQMIARKGIDLLLAAFAGLPERARLLLVGREAELPARLAALPEGVRNRIRYAGFQSPDALPAFFAEADVFVLPSRYDGWGVVVNQALGAGLPIICSDEVGAGFDLVEAGRNGARYPAEDVGALQAAMQGYLDHPEWIAGHGRHSRTLALTMIPEAGAEKWAGILEQVQTTAAL